MHAKPLDAFAASLTVLLCVVWGFNQVVVKLALADVGPVAQTGIRSGVGVVCVDCGRAGTPRSRRWGGRGRRGEGGMGNGCSGGGRDEAGDAGAMATSGCVLVRGRKEGKGKCGCLSVCDAT